MCYGRPLKLLLTLELRTGINLFDHKWLLGVYFITTRGKEAQSVQELRFALLFIQHPVPAAAGWLSTKHLLYLSLCRDCGDGGQDVPPQLT